MKKFLCATLFAVCCLNVNFKVEAIENSEVTVVKEATVVKFNSSLEIIKLNADFKRTSDAVILVINYLEELNRIISNFVEILDSAVMIINGIEFDLKADCVCSDILVALNSTDLINLKIELAVINSDFEKMQSFITNLFGFLNENFADIKAIIEGEISLCVNDEVISLE